MVRLLELKYSRVPVGGQTSLFYCSFPGRFLIDARIHSGPEFLSFEKSVVVDCRARSILSVDLDDKMISQKKWLAKGKPVVVDKRGLLRAFLARRDLYKKLSADEIRLFLLLVVFAEVGKREGKLSWENTKKYLGANFGKDRLKSSASTLEEMGLARMDFPPRQAEIAYRLL